MLTVPRVFEPLVAKGRAKIFHTQRYMIVPPGSFSITQYPERDDLIWILSSFRFSELRNYATGEVIYSTPTERFYLTYECMGGIKRFTLEAYRSFIGVVVNTFLPVTRKWPLVIGIHNETSMTIVGDSISSWVELPMEVWERLVEEGWT